MKNSKLNNVLVVVAHPDDLELMVGGAVAGWTDLGCRVHSVTLTDGVWRTPGGQKMRDAEVALAEEKRAANILGYSVDNLGREAMNLSYSDDLVVEVIRRIEKYQIDTLVCPFEKDIHHDHEVASRIALAAARRVPRVMMGQINYYLREFFTPNIFVDISDTWDRKIEALKCFEDQWSRAKDDWYPFLDDVTKYYGRMIGVDRAEGFVTSRYLI